MTPNEAVALANHGILCRYPIAPPVKMVEYFSAQKAEYVQQNYGDTYSPEELSRYVGKWWADYQCSWEMFAAGLPLSLTVLVHDVTGETERLY